MQTVTFQATTLSVVESTEHTFLMPSKEVAVGYGVTVTAIRQHSQRQSDELIEGKHFIIDRSYKNTPKTMWTKRGIVRLGFFIKSEKAKAFRDWAEDYVLEVKQPKQHPHLPNMPDPYIFQLERENVELKRAMGRLLRASTPPPVTDKTLKQTLVKVHDGYHRILTTCSPIDIIKELSRMTCLFQTIASTNNDGKNLNTQTVAGHSYWDTQKLLKG